MLRAVQIAPADPITWYRYGMLDLAAGRIPEAVEKVQKAIALDPSLPEQSSGLADILAKAGQLRMEGDGGTGVGSRSSSAELGDGDLRPLGGHVRQRPVPPRSR